MRESWSGQPPTKRAGILAKVLANQGVDPDVAEVFARRWDEQNAGEGTTIEQDRDSVLAAFREAGGKVPGQSASANYNADEQFWVDAGYSPEQAAEFAQNARDHQALDAEAVTGANRALANKILSEQIADDDSGAKDGGTPRGDGQDHGGGGKNAALEGQAQGDVGSTAERLAPSESPTPDAQVSLPSEDELGASAGKAQALAQHGVRVTADSAKRSMVEADDDGTIRLNLSPHQGADEGPGYVERSHDEEFKHVFALLAIRRAWEIAGKPIKFNDHLKAHARATFRDLRGRTAKLKGTERREVERAMVASFRMYWGDPRSAKAPDIRTVEDIAAAIEDGGFEGRHADHVAYIHEFARQLRQMQEAGKITEQTLRDILAAIAKWIRDAVGELRGFASAIRSRDHALYQSDFAKLVRRMEAEERYIFGGESALSEDERQELAAFRELAEQRRQQEEKRAQARQERSAQATALAGEFPEGATGSTTYVLGANKRQIPAVYVAVPDESVVASHDGKTFAKNADYPGENTRAYDDPASGEAEKVIRNASDYLPEPDLSNTPSSDSGPPIIARVIREDGTAVLAVVGGNSRRMMRDRIDDSQRQALDAATAQAAPGLGIEGDISPGTGIYRFIGEFDLRKDGQREAFQRAVADTNAQETKAQGQNREAQIAAETAIDPGELAGLPFHPDPAAAQEWIAARIASGALNANKLDHLTRPGAQAEAQAFLDRLMASAALRSPALEAWLFTAEAGNSGALRGLVEAAIPAAIAMRSRNAPALADALSRTLATAADYLRRGKNTTVSTALKNAAEQVEMGEGAETARLLAQALASRIVHHPQRKDGSRPIDTEKTVEGFGEVLGSITRGIAALDGEADIFGDVRTPEHVIRDAIGAAQPATLRARKSLTRPQRIRFLLQKEKSTQGLTRAEHWELEMLERAEGQAFMPFAAEPSDFALESAQEAAAETSSAPAGRQLSLFARQSEFPRNLPEFGERQGEKITIVESDTDAPKSSAQAESWWKERGPRKVIRPGLEASVSGKSISKITSGGKPFPEVRMAAVLHLQPLFYHGARFSRPDNGSDPQVKTIHEIYSPFHHKGETYRIRLLVKEFQESAARGAKLHSARVEDVVVEKSSPASTSDGDARAVPSSASPGYLTLRQLFAEVNPNPEREEPGLRRNAPRATPPDSTVSGPRREEFRGDATPAAGTDQPQTQKGPESDRRSGLRLPRDAGQIQDEGKIFADSNPVKPRESETPPAGPQLHARRSTWDEARQGKSIVTFLRHQGVPVTLMARATKDLKSRLDRIAALEGAQPYLPGWDGGVDPAMGSAQRPARAAQPPASSARDLSREKAHAQATLTAPFMAGQEFAEAFRETDTVSSILPSLVTRTIPAFDIAGHKINAPKDLAALLLPLRSPYFESLKVAFLDKNNRVLHSQILTVGTLGETIAHQRDAVMALAEARRKGKAVSAIFAHNHPSGDPSPSSADIAMHRKFEKVLKGQGIDVLDHIITNGETFYSFRGHGTEPFANPQLASWETVPRSSLKLMQQTEKFDTLRTVLRQEDSGEFGHIIYGGTRLNILGVERFPVAEVGKPEFVARIIRGTAREGAQGVWLDIGSSSHRPRRIVDDLSDALVHVHDIASEEHGSARAQGLMARTSEPQRPVPHAEAIADAMREVEGRIPHDLIEKYRHQAMAEAEGEFTIGRPDLAHGAGDAVTRAIDETRKSTATRVSNDRLHAEAQAMLKADYEGMKRRLLEAATDPDLHGNLTDIETRAAALLRVDLAQRAVATGNRDLMREAEILTWAYRESGTQQARALGLARRDPFKKRADRNRDYLLDRLFSIDPAVVARFHASPEAARKSATIDRLKGRLAAAKAQNNRSEIAALTEALRRERMEYATMQNDANAEWRAKIDKALADMGITMDDIFSDRAELRLKGRTYIKEATKGLDERRRRAVEMMLDGISVGRIRRVTGLTSAQMDAVLADLNRNLDEKLSKLGDAALDPDKFDVSQLFAAVSAGAAKLSAGERAARIAAIKRAMGVPTSLKEYDAQQRNFRRKATKRRKGQVVGPVFDPSNERHVLAVGDAIDMARGARWNDYVREGFINNILSAPTTAMANATGYGYAIYQSTIQRALEATFATATGKEGPSFAEFRIIAEGLKGKVAKSWQLAIEAWDDERSPFSREFLDQPLTSGNPTMDSRQARHVIPGRAGRVLRTPTRFLLAMDTFARSLVAMTEVGALAHRMGKAAGLQGQALSDFIAGQVNLPGSAAWQAASELAGEWTFTNPLRTARQGGGAIEATVKKVSDIVNERRDTLSGQIGEILGQMFLPFITTPFRLAQAGLRKTWLGAGFNGIRALGGLRIIDGKITFASLTDAQKLSLMADGFAAAMAFGVLWALTEGDDDDKDKFLLVTGTRPVAESTRGERELAMRTVPPQTIRLGGEGGIQFSYARLDPFSTIIATTVDAIRQIKAMRKGRGFNDALAGLQGHMVAQVQDKTFMRGMQDMALLLEGTRSVPEWAVRQMAAVLVPNIIRNPLRALDDKVRDMRTEPFSKEAIVYNFLPNPVFAPPAQRDLHGREIVKGGNFATRALLPGNIESARQPKPLDRFITNYNRENPAERWAPQRPAPTYTDARGEKRRMTPRQYSEFLRVRGQFQDRELLGINAMLGHKRPTADEKEKVRSALMRATRDAKAFLFGAPITIPGEN
ncbi:MAG: hypothetical protein IAE97_06340 [Chthoniobacterales bacterium]|nr:hypothetical protein [Chthoniobacterales bacterium]